MSFTTVNKAVAALVMEAKLSVVDDLVTFLEAKIEVDGDLKAMFDEFKENLKENEEKAVKAAGKKVKGGKKSSSDESGEKKKRAPSVFNLYVKDVMPDMKAKHPDIKDGKQMIGFASEAWKSDPMASFIKEKVAEMKAEDKDSDIVELYAKAKAMYKNTDESSVEPESEPEPAKVSKSAAKKPAVKKADESDSEKEKPVVKKTAGKKTAKKESDTVDDE